VSVRIDSRALAQAEALAGAALPRETGGILLGHRVDAAVIVGQLLQVPDKEARPAKYLRRHALAQQALDRVMALERPDSPLGYVGEWHSHPGDVGPSRQDVKELRASARQLKDAVALVVLCREGHSWIARAWMAQGWRTWPSATIEIIDGTRQEDRQDEA
jgi:integrative and conjugative element protein (TIGR02256 family)